MNVIFVADEWTPYFAARELLGRNLNRIFEYNGRRLRGRNLQGEVQQAILLGQLKAERRPVYVRGRVEREDYFCKPADVIEWALNVGLPVPDEYAAWYRDRIKPGKRGPKGGPRDANVYRVITGLALANGYRPGQKQAQGWRNKIISELDQKGISLDPDKLTDIIKDAFDKLKIN